MSKYVGYRADEAQLEILDRVAAVRHGGNRSAALAAAVDFYVAHVGACPQCGAINPEGAQFCAQCACPLTADARDQIAMMKRSVIDPPCIWSHEAVYDLKMG